MNIDSRVASGLALVLGGYVVVAEIPFWSSRSALAPVLTAIGLAIVSLAVAQLFRERRP
jgi:hypothetical protein